MKLTRIKSCLVAAMTLTLGCGSSAFAGPIEGAALVPYQEKLQEILNRQEFRAELRKQGKLDLNWSLPGWEAPDFFEWLGNKIGNMFEGVGDAIGELFDAFFNWMQRQQPQGAMPGGGSILPSLFNAGVWVLAIVGGWLFVYLVYRYLSHPGSTSERPTLEAVHDPMMDALSRPIEEWRLAAQEHESRGEWRLALRASYLAVLSMLHHRKAIHYSREKTNGEYVAFLSGAPAGSPFRQLTNVFDFAWYGNKEFDEEKFHAALDIAQSIDRATVAVNEGKPS